MPSETKNEKQTDETGVHDQLAKIGCWYDREMKTRPLLTKSWTAFVLSSMSNGVAQILQRRLNIREILSFALQATPPYSHFWFMFLDRHLGPKDAILKTAVDQIFFRPLILAYMFMSSGMLSGHKWSAIKHNMRQNLLKAIFDGWKLWPAVMFLNQRFVPALYQSSAMDVVGFCWDIYLSILQSRVRKISN